MSTHMPGFLLFFSFFLHHFVLAKLASTSIRVNHCREVKREGLGGPPYVLIQVWTSNTVL